MTTEPYIPIDSPFQSNDSLDVQISVSLDSGDFYLSLFSLLAITSWWIYILFFNSRVFGSILTWLVSKRKKDCRVKFVHKRCLRVFLHGLDVHIYNRSTTYNNLFELFDQKLSGLEHPICTSTLRSQLTDPSNQHSVNKLNNQESSNEEEYSSSLDWFWLKVKLLLPVVNFNSETTKFCFGNNLLPRALVISSSRLTGSYTTGKTDVSALDKYRHCFDADFQQLSCSLLPVKKTYCGRYPVEEGSASHQIHTKDSAIAKRLRSIDLDNVVARPPREFGNPVEMMHLKSGHFQYIQDEPGPTPLTPSSEEKPPAWSMTINASKQARLGYGPWAERHRDMLWQFFYPPSFQTSPIDPTPLAGQLRTAQQFELSVTTSCSFDLDLCFQDKSETNQILVKSKPASTISLVMPWVTGRDGFTTALSLSLLQAHIQLPNHAWPDLLRTKADLTLDLHLYYPRAWNEAQCWSLSLTANSPQLSMLFDYKHFFKNLIEDWIRGAKSDLHKFIPCIYKFSIKAKQLDFILLANEYNWIFPPGENSKLSISARELLLTFDLSFIDYLPSTVQIDYCIDVCDGKLRMCVPETSTLFHVIREMHCRLKLVDSRGRVKPSSPFGTYEEIVPHRDEVVAPSTSSRFWLPGSRHKQAAANRNATTSASASSTSYWVDCALAENLHLTINYTYHPSPLVDDTFWRIVPALHDKLKEATSSTASLPRIIKGGPTDELLRQHFNAESLAPDSVSVLLRIPGAELCLYGAIIDHFINMKDNYFGDRQTPVKSDTGPLKPSSLPLILQSLPHADSNSHDVVDPRDLRPMVVKLSLEFHNIQAHLPTYCTTSNATPCPTGFVDCIGFEMDKRWHETKLHLLVSPVLICVPDPQPTHQQQSNTQQNNTLAPSATHDPRHVVYSMGRLQMLGLSLRGQAMFSHEQLHAKAETLEYAWLLELNVGQLSGQLTSPQLTLLGQVVEFLVNGLLNPENRLESSRTFELCQHAYPQSICPYWQPVTGHAVCPTDLDLKYKLFRLTVDTCQIGLVESNDCLLIDLDPIRLTTCNMHTGVLRPCQGLSALLPNIRLIQLTRPQAAKKSRFPIGLSSTTAPLPPAWLEAGSFNLGPVNINSARAPDYAEHRGPLQLAFLQLHDQRTKRLWFLWSFADPVDLDMDALIHSSLVKMSSSSNSCQSSPSTSPLPPCCGCFGHCSFFGPNRAGQLLSSELAQSRLAHRVILPTESRIEGRLVATTSGDDASLSTISDLIDRRRQSCLHHLSSPRLEDNLVDCRSEQPLLFGTSILSPDNYLYELHSASDCHLGANGYMLMREEVVVAWLSMTTVSSESVPPPHHVHTEACFAHPPTFDPLLGGRIGRDAGRRSSRHYRSGHCDDSLSAGSSTELLLIPPSTDDLDSSPHGGAAFETSSLNQPHHDELSSSMPWRGQAPPTPPPRRWLASASANQQARPISDSGAAQHRRRSSLVDGDTADRRTSSSDDPSTKFIDIHHQLNRPIVESPLLRPAYARHLSTYHCLSDWLQSLPRISRRWSLCRHLESTSLDGLVNTPSSSSQTTTCDVLFHRLGPALAPLFRPDQAGFSPRSINDSANSIKKKTKKRSNQARQREDDAMDQQLSAPPTPYRPEHRSFSGGDHATPALCATALKSDSFITVAVHKPIDLLLTPLLTESIERFVHPLVSVVTSMSPSAIIDSLHAKCVTQVKSEHQARLDSSITDTTLADHHHRPTSSTVLPSVNVGDSRPHSHSLSYIDPLQHQSTDSQQLPTVMINRNSTSRPSSWLLPGKKQPRSSQQQKQQDDHFEGPVDDAHIPVDPARRQNRNESNSNRPISAGDVTYPTDTIVANDQQPLGTNSRELISIAVDRVNLCFLQLYPIETSIHIDSIRSGMHDITCVSLLALCVDSIGFEILSCRECTTLSIHHAPTTINESNEAASPVTLRQRSPPAPAEEERPTTASRDDSVNLSSFSHRPMVSINSFRCNQHPFNSPPLPSSSRSTHPPDNDGSIVDSAGVAALNLTTVTDVQLESPRPSQSLGCNDDSRSCNLIPANQSPLPRSLSVPAIDHQSQTGEGQKPGSDNASSNTIIGGPVAANNGGGGDQQDLRVSSQFEHTLSTLYRLKVNQIHGQFRRLTHFSQFDESVILTAIPLSSSDTFFAFQADTLSNVQTMPATPSSSTSTGSGYEVLQSAGWIIFECGMEQLSSSFIRRRKLDLCSQTTSSSEQVVTNGVDDRRSQLATKMAKFPSLPRNKQSQPNSSQGHNPASGSFSNLMVETVWLHFAAPKRLPNKRRIKLLRGDWNLLSTAAPAIKAWIDPVGRLTRSTRQLLGDHERRQLAVIACLMTESASNLSPSGRSLSNMPLPFGQLEALTKHPHCLNLLTQALRLDPSCQLFLVLRRLLFTMLSRYGVDETDRLLSDALLDSRIPSNLLLQSGILSLTRDWCFLAQWLQVRSSTIQQQARVSSNGSDPLPRKGKKIDGKSGSPTHQQRRGAVSSNCVLTVPPPSPRRATIPQPHHSSELVESNLLRMAMSPRVTHQQHSTNRRVDDDEEVDADVESIHHEPRNYSWSQDLLHDDQQTDSMPHIRKDPTDSSLLSRFLRDARASVLANQADRNQYDYPRLCRSDSVEMVHLASSPLLETSNNIEEGAPTMVNHQQSPPPPLFTSPLPTPSNADIEQANHLWARYQYISYIQHLFAPLLQSVGLSAKGIRRTTLMKKFGGLLSGEGLLKTFRIGIVTSARNPLNPDSNTSLAVAKSDVTLSRTAAAAPSTSRKLSVDATSHRRPPTTGRRGSCTTSSKQRSSRSRAKTDDIVAGLVSAQDRPSTAFVCRNFASKLVLRNVADPTVKRKSTLVTSPQSTGDDHRVDVATLLTTQLDAMFDVDLLQQRVNLPLLRLVHQLVTMCYCIQDGQKALSAASTTLDEDDGDRVPDTPFSSRGGAGLTPTTVKTMATTTSCYASSSSTGSCSSRATIKSDSKFSSSDKTGETIRSRLSAYMPLHDTTSLDGHCHNRGNANASGIPSSPNSSGDVHHIDHHRHHRGHRGTGRVRHERHQFNFSDPQTTNNTDGLVDANEDHPALADCWSRLTNLVNIYNTVPVARTISLQQPSPSAHATPATAQLVAMPPIAEEEGGNVNESAGDNVSASQPPPARSNFKRTASQQQRNWLSKTKKPSPTIDIDVTNQTVTFQVPKSHHHHPHAPASSYTIDETRRRRPSHRRPATSNQQPQTSPGNLLASQSDRLVILVFSSFKVRRMMVGAVLSELNLTGKVNDVYANFTHSSRVATIGASLRQNITRSMSVQFRECITTLTERLPSKDQEVVRLSTGQSHALLSFKNHPPANHRRVRGRRPITKPNDASLLVRLGRIDVELPHHPLRLHGVVQRQAHRLSHTVSELLRNPIIDRTMEDVDDVNDVIHDHDEDTILGVVPPTDPINTDELTVNTYNEPGGGSEWPSTGSEPMIVSTSRYIPPTASLTTTPNVVTATTTCSSGSSSATTTVSDRYRQRHSSVLGQPNQFRGRTASSVAGDLPSKSTQIQQQPPFLLGFLAVIDAFKLSVALHPTLTAVYSVQPINFSGNLGHRYNVDFTITDHSLSIKSIDPPPEFPSSVTLRFPRIRALLRQRMSEGGRYVTRGKWRREVRPLTYGLTAKSGLYLSLSIAIDTMEQNLTMNMFNYIVVASTLFMREIEEIIKKMAGKASPFTPLIEAAASFESGVGTGGRPGQSNKQNSWIEKRVSQSTLQVTVRIQMKEIQLMTSALNGAVKLGLKHIEFELTNRVTQTATNPPVTGSTDLPLMSAITTSKIAPTLNRSVSHQSTSCLYPSASSTSMQPIAGRSMGHHHASITGHQPPNRPSHLRLSSTLSRTSYNTVGQSAGSQPPPPMMRASTTTTASTRSPTLSKSTVFSAANQTDREPFFIYTTVGQFLVEVGSLDYDMWCQEKMPDFKKLAVFKTNIELRSMLTDERIASGKTGVLAPPPPAGTRVSGGGETDVGYYSTSDKRPSQPSSSSSRERDAFLISVDHPMLWVKPFTVDRCILMWVSFKGEFDKWYNHMEMLASRVGTGENSFLHLGSSEVKVEADNLLRGQSSEKLVTGGSGGSQFPSLFFQFNVKGLGICMPLDTMPLSSYSLDAALVLTLDTMRISACYRNSLVTRSEFKRFCLRFDDEFNMGSDDWSPNIDRSTVTIRDQLHLVLMNACHVPDGSLVLCYSELETRHNFRLAAQWQMRGLDFHFDDNIGRRIKALVATLTRITGFNKTPPNVATSGEELDYHHRDHHDGHLSTAKGGGEIEVEMASLSSLDVKPPPPSVEMINLSTSPLPPPTSSSTRLKSHQRLPHDEYGEVVSIDDVPSWSHVEQTYQLSQVRSMELYKRRADLEAVQFCHALKQRKWSTLRKHKGIHVSRKDRRSRHQKASRTQPRRSDAAMATSILPTATSSLPRISLVTSQPPNSRTLPTATVDDSSSSSVSGSASLSATADMFTPTLEEAAASRQPPGLASHQGSVYYDFDQPTAEDESQPSNDDEDDEDEYWSDYAEDDSFIAPLPPPRVKVNGGSEQPDDDERFIVPPVPPQFRLNVEVEFHVDSGCCVLHPRLVKPPLHPSTGGALSGWSFPTSVFTDRPLLSNNNNNAAASGTAGIGGLTATASHVDELPAYLDRYKRQLVQDATSLPTDISIFYLPGVQLHVRHSFFTEVAYKPGRVPAFDPALPISKDSITVASNNETGQTGTLRSVSESSSDQAPSRLDPATASTTTTTKAESNIEHRQRLSDPGTFEEPGGATNGKPNLYISVKLEKLPKEIVVHPALLNFLEQALENLPLTTDTGPDDNEPDDSNSEIDPDQSKNSPTQSNSPVDVFDDLLYEYMPLHAIVHFNSQPSTVRFVCIPNSRVQCLMELPALDIVLSAKRGLSPQDSSTSSNDFLCQQSRATAGDQEEEEAEDGSNNGGSRSISGFEKKSSTTRSSSTLPQYTIGGPSAGDVISRVNISLTAIFEGFRVAILHPYRGQQPLLSTQSWPGDYVNALLRHVRFNMSRQVQTSLVALPPRPSNTIPHRDDPITHDNTLPPKETGGGGNPSDVWGLHRDVFFSGTYDVGEAVFLCDIRHIAEILDIPKVWYRSSFARQLFLGNEKTATDPVTEAAFKRVDSDHTTTASTGTTVNNSGEGESDSTTSMQTANEGHEDDDDSVFRSGRDRRHDDTIRRPPHDTRLQPPSTLTDGACGSKLKHKSATIAVPYTASSSAPPLQLPSHLLPNQHIPRRSGDSTLASPSTTLMPAEHRQAPGSASLRLASWHSLPLFAVKFKRFDIHLFVGSAMGRTRLLLDNLFCSGRVSLNSIGRSNTTVSAGLSNCQFISEEGVVGGEFSLVNASTHVRLLRDQSRDPRHLFEIGLGGVQLRLEYMGANILFFRLNDVSLTLSNEWHLRSPARQLVGVGRGKRSSPSQTPPPSSCSVRPGACGLKVHGELHWDQLHCLLSRSTTPDIILSIYKLKTYMKEQFQLGRRSLLGHWAKSSVTTTNSITTTKPSNSQPSTPATADEDVVLVDRLLKRWWQSLIEHSLQRFLAELATSKSLLAQETTTPSLTVHNAPTLGGSLSLTGNSIGIACFSGTFRTAPDWAVFNIQQPSIKFTTKARRDDLTPTITESADADAKTTGYNTDWISVNQSLAFELGPRSNAPKSSIESPQAQQNALMAFVLRVKRSNRSETAATSASGTLSSRGGPGAGALIGDWMNFAFHSADNVVADLIRSSPIKQQDALIKISSFAIEFDPPLQSVLPPDVGQSTVFDPSDPSSTDAATAPTTPPPSQPVADTGNNTTGTGRRPASGKPNLAEILFVLPSVSLFVSSEQRQALSTPELTDLWFFHQRQLSGHSPQLSSTSSTRVVDPFVGIKFETDFRGYVLLGLIDVPWLPTLIKSYLTERLAAADKLQSAHQSGTPASKKPPPSGSRPTATTATISESTTTTTSVVSIEAGTSSKKSSSSDLSVDVIRERLEQLSVTSSPLVHDLRRFDVLTWEFSPEYRCLPAAHIGMQALDMLLERIGFHKGRSTFPKWLQRGAMDHLDKCIVLLLTTDLDKLTPNAAASIEKPSQSKENDK